MALSIASSLCLGCGARGSISEAPALAAPSFVLGSAIREKQRGVSWVAGNVVTATELQPLVDLGVNWIVQTPFGWQKTYNSPEIRLVTSGHVYWGEQDVGIETTTRIARDLGIKTLLKPHLWLQRADPGKWRSDIAMESKADWDSWFDSYRIFILHYANLAHRLEIEALAIGTELRQTAVQKPAAWRHLISDIRQIYSGQLTYSANWYQEFEEIVFWNDLDFIGIQAYFPLSDRNLPELYDLKTGWTKYMESIEKIHNRYQKSVVFTEIGYRSSIDAAIEPWKWPSRSTGVASSSDLETQLRCYQAFFETFWHRPWFAGAYIWKWHPHPRPNQGLDRNFSPQKKPAEKVLERWYGGGSPKTTLAPSGEQMDRARV
ncbi:MAG: glycoside hydrolase TIM-barrel-like domain-containing protein [Thermoanaerobaculia bacterium]